jgi:hypothetical protein
LEVVGEAKREVICQKGIMAVQAEVHRRQWLNDKDLAQQIKVLMGVVVETQAVEEEVVHRKKEKMEEEQAVAMAAMALHLLLLAHL